MIGRPAAEEAAPYYAGYIAKAPGENPLRAIEEQLDEAAKFFGGISEEKSLNRYAADKWSLRELLSHINDTERVFSYRAVWFARGFDSPLPSFDQEIGVKGAGADSISWAAHVEEFRRIRAATISLFRNLPADAWMRSGIASDNRVTVRALAFIMVGHVNHHIGVVRERYL